MTRNQDVIDSLAILQDLVLTQISSGGSGQKLGRSERDITLFDSGRVVFRSDFA